MRENASAKGRRYLVEGRLIVQRVDPYRVEATCRGDGVVYRLGFRDGSWHCSCDVRTDRCSHLYALRSVCAVDLGEAR